MGRLDAVLTSLQLRYILVQGVQDLDVDRYEPGGSCSEKFLVPNNSGLRKLHAELFDYVLGQEEVTPCLYQVLPYFSLLLVSQAGLLHHRHLRKRI